jgi:hypothetical protein
VPEFKAGGGFEPETYTEYFEDSNPPPNAEIGCKMPFPDGHYARANVNTSTDAAFALSSTRVQALTVAPVVNTSSTSKIRHPRIAEGSDN